MKEKDTHDITFPDQVITPVDMTGEIKRSFIEYSMSVITARALPDVRDGMKPGARRILYAMYEDGLTNDKPFRKSATTVGNVLGRYHPHGDSAVYMTMVRMAQPFSLRYPLVEGHGNFGNIDGDPPAAYRYTEARMARLCDYMLDGIDKNVVKMTKNFDNRLDEPTVLPSRFPNLLVNGSVGIAVGMATNIPTHNLGEVIDGAIHLMYNPDANVYDLMKFIKGPDFPTGAIIYGSGGILESYATGRGRITVRSRAELDEEHHRIIISEIPFQVYRSTLVMEMAALVREKKVEGITDIRDESGRAGMRIVVDLRRDANGSVILNQLYKNSSLQSTFAVNMLALVNGEPKTLTLKQMLEQYILHQESVIRRRTKFELDKALAEMHLYEGYKIACDNIDEVITIIRASESTQAARSALQARFELTDIQAQAIVDMTLGRLTGMERQKIEDRLARLIESVTNLRSILADESKIKEIIRDEMLEIKAKFNDDRRTEIIENGEDIIIEDLIEKHDCVITMTDAGYIKRQPADTYSAQRRGGKGIIGMATKEEDFIDKVAVAHSHSTLLLFTNLGRVYSKRAFEIPEASRQSKGSNIVNLLTLSQGERVTAIVSLDMRHDFDPEAGKFIVMVTKYGLIKRVRATEFQSRLKGGKIAIRLGSREEDIIEDSDNDEVEELPVASGGDELLFVSLTEGTSDMFIATKTGKAARFSESAFRSLGRTAMGVRAIKLSDGDEVAGALVINEDRQLLTVTENGFGKLTQFGEFRAKGRNIKGMRCHNINDKTGLLAGIAMVAEDDDVMLISDDGTLIRFAASDIRETGRAAAGVIVMRLGEGSKVVGVAIVKESEEIDADAADISDESADIDAPIDINADMDTDTAIIPDTDRDADGSVNLTEIADDDV